MEVGVSADSSAGFVDTVAGVQIHFTVFDAATQPFDKHVAALSTFAARANGRTVVGECAVEPALPRESHSGRRPRR
jgi:hypothetical protein